MCPGVVKGNRSDLHEKFFDPLAQLSIRVRLSPHQAMLVLVTCSGRQNAGAISTLSDHEIPLVDPRHLHRALLGTTHASVSEHVMSPNERGVAHSTNV
jgi:hypothetical protein